MFFIYFHGLFNRIMYEFVRHLHRTLRRIIKKSQAHIERTQRELQVNSSGIEARIGLTSKDPMCKMLAIFRACGTCKSAVSNFAFCSEIQDIDPGVLSGACGDCLLLGMYLIFLVFVFVFCFCVKSSTFHSVDLSVFCFITVFVISSTTCTTAVKYPSISPLLKFH